MAMTKAMLVWLVAILVGLSTSSHYQAEAQLGVPIPNIPSVITLSVNLTVNGTLVCPSNGAPLVGVDVTLLANGRPIGSNTTGINGSVTINVLRNFNILIVAQLQEFLNFLNLTARISLPVTSCPALGNSGTLVVPVRVQSVNLDLPAGGLRVDISARVGLR